MSGGRFLVALREVKTSDKILQMKSLLKKGFDFWKMDLQPNDVSIDNLEEVTRFQMKFRNVSWIRKTHKLLCLLQDTLQKCF